MNAKAYERELKFVCNNVITSKQFAYPKQTFKAVC